MKHWSFVAVTVALCGLGLVGCDEAKKAAGGDCDADISAKFNALNDAAENLASVSVDMKVDLIAACNDITTGLGGDATDPADGDKPTDDEVSTACDAASAAIDAEVTAGAHIEVIVQGGGCQIDAEAQISCEADCSVDAECDPGKVDVRCDPGQLSVECSGECKVDAYCEADVAIDCHAECQGTCEGTCSAECRGTAECTGTCEGTCDGECSVALGEDGSCSGTCTGTCKGTCSASTSCEGECMGSCEGSCTGSCKLEAQASCGADARCKGGCDGEFTAPKCEGELTPPSCDIDADCQAGCDGQAKFKATCSEPKVQIVVSGEANADLQATLEGAFPKLLSVAARGELVGDAAGDVVSKFGGAVTAVGEVPGCVAAFGADLAAAASASVEASASFSVSVMASASVEGSATAE